MLGGEFRKVPRYRRSELAPEQSITGPAVIEEASSSIVIDAADRARRGPEGTLIVDVGRNA
jgi:N-methylhydantoinase A/oxoprolinase/acetone carboxylase beta subunit